jgi:hypothetical protein
MSDRNYIALLAITLFALLVSHIVAALVGTHFGYEAGAAAERARYTQGSPG